MAKPEKHPKDDSNLNPPDSGTPENPDFGAIMPEKAADPAQEIVEDIEGYQHKLEDEWDQAKEKYESKINKIMDDFLKENILDAAPIPEKPKKSESKEIRKPHDPHRINRLLADVERTLQRKEKKRSPFHFLSDIRPPIINVSVRRGKFFNLKKFWPTVSHRLALLGFGVWFFSPLHIAKVTKLPYAHTTGPIISDGKNLYCRLVS